MQNVLNAVIVLTNLGPETPEQEYQPNGDESDRTIPYGQH